MTADTIARANEILINVYNFWPVMFDRGQGCYLYDTDGKKYLDFGAGIAVMSLGYQHPAYTAALKKQIEKLPMGLCYALSGERIAAAETLVGHTGLDQVFFTNSGAEAVESALKIARKWSVETKGPDCTEMIHFGKAFHGRTMGALSVNGMRMYREGFEPLLTGTHKAEFNNLESVKSFVSPRTAAIIVEPILGEGGIIAGKPEFIKGLRDLCDKQNIALIFDEVQTGVGRTGHMFAADYYGVKPDLMALAKGLGGGFPVGACVGKKKFTKHITPGSHGGTYGGNPIACAAASVVLNEVSKPGFMENVMAVGDHLRAGLEKIAASTNAITAVRGVGLMIAADYAAGEVKTLVKDLLKAGLVTLSAGSNSLRLVPPLILTKGEADEGLAIIEKVLKS